MRLAKLLVVLLTWGAVARADVSAPGTPSPAAKAARLRTRWPVACTRVLGAWLDRAEGGVRWLGRDGKVLLAREGGLAPRDSLEVRVPANIGEAAAAAYEVEVSGGGQVVLAALCAAEGRNLHVHWTCTRDRCQTSTLRRERRTAAPLGGQATGPAGAAVWIPPPFVHPPEPSRLQAAFEALVEEARAVAAVAAPGKWPVEPAGEPPIVRDAGKTGWAAAARRGDATLTVHCTVDPMACWVTRAGPSGLISYRTEVRWNQAGPSRQVTQAIVGETGNWQRLAVIDVHGRPGEDSINIVTDGDLLPVRE